MSGDGITLLCIGGTGQNGATLLCRMLGRIPGYVAVGELGYLWDKGLIENVECGCGLPFFDCPFWTRVGEEAFGGWDGVDPHEALRLRGAIKRKGRLLAHPLSLPFILFPFLSPGYRRDFLRYAELMRRLYEGIHAVSGGRVIVDSMKRPSHVFMMRKLPRIDLRLAHLVRDSRGVAYSNLKWVPRQGAAEHVFRVRRRPWKTAARWMWINAAFHLLAGLGVPSTVVRYEKFVEDPTTELIRLAELAGTRLEPEDLSFIAGDEVELPSDHLVAGNRMRLRTGPIRLRVDEEWRRGLTHRQQQIVSTVSWPLLRRYGYVERAAG